MCAGGVAIKEAWLSDVEEPCNGDKLCLRCPGEVGDRSVPSTFSSKLAGDISAERDWRPNAVLGPGWTGEVGDRRLPSRLNRRLNSFSKLSRIRLPAFSFRPYGLVCTVGRFAAPDVSVGPLPMGRRGSRLYFMDAVRSDGTSVDDLTSSAEWSALSVPSEILSRW